MSIYTDNIPATGNNVLADVDGINDNLDALRSLESSASAPANAVAGMFWFDTANGLIKQRNAANTAWITLWIMDESASFPVGTKMAFFQAAAPIGWTQDTSQNDKALRVVNGAGGGGGGTLSFSSATVGNHTLTISEIPSHFHSVPFVNSNVGDNLRASDSSSQAQVGTYDTTSTGGGAAHNHSLALAYIDIIICTKD